MRPLRFNKKRQLPNNDRANELTKQIEGVDKNIEQLKLNSAPQAMIDSLMNHRLVLDKELRGVINNKTNAKKAVYNGEVYDSTREANYAKRLDELKWSWKRQVEFELLPKLVLLNEVVQPTTLTVDFLIYDRYIVDVKGMVMEDFKLRWKMLKHKYQDKYIYFLVASEQDFTYSISHINLYQRAANV